MNLAVVCQYYYPEPFRITEICEALVERGHIVTVFTGLPNYPMGEIASEFRHGRRRRESVNGVAVQRYFEIARGPGVIRLALNYASFVVSASMGALRSRDDYDSVFVYQLSPVTMALPGIILKWKNACPLYLYCCDIWPESVKTLVPGEGSVFYRLARWVSRFVYQRCDAIGVTSPAFSAYLEQVDGVSTDRIAYLPQHANDPRVVNSSRSGPGAEVYFIGNMGVAQDIDCILDAAEMLRDIPGLVIHFVGDGSRYEYTSRTVCEKQLEGRVILHGRFPSDRLGEFYSSADACLLTLRSDNVTGQTIPAKLQEYMAAGKPIIAATDGAVRQLIEDAECGVCVSAGDAVGLASALKRLAGDRGAFQRCGANARRYYEQHFTKRIFMDALEEALQSLVDAHGERAIRSDT